MSNLITKEISDENMHYSFGYYAENKWLDGKRLVLMRSNIPEMIYDGTDRVKTELIIYDTEIGDADLVDTGIGAFTDFLADRGKVYYVKDGALIVYNPNTCQKKTLFTAERIGSLHISADGKYISLFSCSPEICRFYRVNTESGEGELMFETSFGGEFPYANHGMISPTDKDVLFFAHEGDTRIIGDRLWIYDMREGLARNIAPQNLDEEGLPLDCFGHEAWAHNGDGLYFVKYRESRTKPGICYADIKGNPPQLLYTGYDYWHVGTSSSGRYLTADTRNLGADRSGVVLIDIKTGKEMLIDAPHVTFRHPCHPHPQLSPDDKFLIYHFQNEYGRVAVKLVSLCKNEQINESNNSQM